jgi:mono/diheme cytochrome c family protein
MMKRACLLALTTATFLAACSSDKPAVSDSLKTNPELASPAGTALPADTAASQVVTPIEQAPAPSTKPSSPATQPVRTATSKAAPVPAANVPKSTVTAAPARVTPVPVTPAPVAAAPRPTAPPAPEVAAAPSASAQALAGKAPYEENCRKCHGVIGIAPKAMKAKFPKIATFDAAFFATRSGDSVVTILTKGKNQDMTSFKDKLSHAQMVAVAAYIRTFAK